jgi:hypothetical protein
LLEADNDVVEGKDVKPVVSSTNNELIVVDVQWRNVIIL